MSNERARYEPVAWWFTRRRLGRGLRAYYQAPGEFPVRLLTLIKMLDRTPEVSLDIVEDSSSSAVGGAQRPSGV
jgi:hypothetical protein